MFFQYLITFFIFSLILYLMYKIYKKYIEKDIISEDESLQEIQKRTEEKERRLKNLKVEDNCLDKEINITIDLNKTTSNTSQKYKKLEKLNMEKK